MAGGIFLIGDDGRLVRMDEAAYASEDLLQGLLANYPDLLAGDQIDPSSPRRWLLVKREMGIGDSMDTLNRWSLDHLFLDQDGIPTLIEVKRSNDTRVRREVVGQMLDYAANAVVHWPVERIRAEFEARCEREKLEADAELAAFLPDDHKAEMFWQSVKTNLQAGRVRMVFISDMIPSELRRIVEFLNQQMDPAEVLALEVKQFVGQGQRSLVPRLIGQSAEAEQRKGVADGLVQIWDEESFFADLQAKCTPSEVSVARRLLEWSKRQDEVSWGRGRRQASYSPVITRDRARHQIFVVWSSGFLELYFYWWARKPPFSDEKLWTELLSKFGNVAGISLPPDVKNLRPSIPLRTFADERNLVQLIEVFNWMAGCIKSAR